MVEWAKRDIAGGGGQGCCGLAFAIIGWSPLPAAHRYAEELLRTGRKETFWHLIQEDSPQPLPWDRLELLARLGGDLPQVNRELRELLEEPARDGEPRAREILDILKARA